MAEKIKSFLDEGFDFIEESYSDIPLEFTEVNEDIIVESKDNKQHPYHILGVCKGVFQPINEPSRNLRMYDPDHWEFQIAKPELQERLQNRQMLGQIGHRDARVDDLTISRGEVSHVVTCMEVREDLNGKPYLYGELEILDTPAGRILKGLYEGGVGLYISSRGAGKLESMPEQLGQDPRMKRVSKTSYFLETWDLVMRPGFLKARPVYETADSVEQTQQPTLQEKQIKESAEETQPRVIATTATAGLLKAPLATSYTISSTPSWQPTVATNEEVEELKGQIDKLAKVLEKVVDDVYEVDEAEEQSTEPTSESKAALIGALGLLSNSNISEGLFEQIVEIIKKSKEKK